MNQPGPERENAPGPFHMRNISKNDVYKHKAVAK